jgi:D-alanyl-D-alanine dipeptidase
MTRHPLLSAEHVPLPGSAAEAVPLPVLIPESACAASAVAAQPASHQAEPLVEVAGDAIPALHSYAQAGWAHAADRQWLRAGLLVRLQQATETLPPGFGLAIFDGWRPLALQRELYETLTPGLDPDGPVLVAPPAEDPAAPPPHLTGGAVDLTLTWNSVPLALGTGFDEFTPRAAASAFEHVPGPVRALRRLLYHALHQHGLVVLADEWWHFEYGTRLWSALTAQPVRYGPIDPGPSAAGPQAGGA